jgi:hypothetical protein
MIFILSACTTSNVITPTKTFIPTLTSTSTPAPTITFAPTEIPMPDFMEEFIELGYDKQSLESDAIYVVLDEKSAVYGNGDFGLKYKDAYLTSWTPAYYISDGKLQKVFIITSYSVKAEIYTELNPWWDFYFPIGDHIKGQKIPINTKFSRGTLTALFNLIAGEYPILKAELNWQRFKTLNLGNQEHFITSLYPPFSGRVELIDISGIGKVLPVTNFVIDLKQLQTPTPQP